MSSPSRSSSSSEGPSGKVRHQVNLDRAVDVDPVAHFPHSQRHRSSGDVRRADLHGRTVGPMSRPAVASVPALVTVLLLAGVLSLVSGLTAATATARPGGKQAAVKYADTAHGATNQVRAKRDMATLEHDACLRRAAKKQAQVMARQGELSHQSLSVVAGRCHMGYVGENVAYGFASGRAVVRGWMKSPGHRDNILNTHYRAMGIAAVKRNGIWWVAQVFGRRR